MASFCRAEHHAQSSISPDWRAKGPDEWAVERRLSLPILAAMEAGTFTAARRTFCPGLSFAFSVCWNKFSGFLPAMIAGGHSER
jgi:hypothetical protein